MCHSRNIILPKLKVIIPLLRVENAWVYGLIIYL